MEEQLRPVYMTACEYKAVVAALNTVCDDGERRTDLTDGDKAGTAVFGDICLRLVVRNGNPCEGDDNG